MRNNIQTIARETAEAINPGPGVEKIARLVKVGIERGMVSVLGRIAEHANESGYVRSIISLTLAEMSEECR